MRRKYRKVLGIAMAVAVSVTALPTMAFATEPVAETTEDAKKDNLMRLWYEKPATDWQTEALAIGNGYMGGLVFGRTAKDKIHLNEKTVWKGGPTDGRMYNYGNTNPTETEEDLQVVKNDLQAIREKLDDKSQYVFGYSEDSYSSSGTSTKGEAMDALNKLMGNLVGYDSPQDYADLYIETGHQQSDVTNYVRDLDMNTALATVNYDYEGVHYTREYFNSYPDNVMVVRLTADKDGKVNFKTNVEHKSGITSNYDVKDNTITLSGKMYNNNLKVEGQLRVLSEGGKVETDGNALRVTDADAATLIFSCGTDYKMELPKFRGEDPHKAISARIEAATAKGYEKLKADHVSDHSALFSRMDLSFDEEVPQMPTDVLIQKYRDIVDGKDPLALTEGEQRALEIMCYQFGRYLTIAGSREGALPTNLQGVWGEDSFMWGGDYHFNINVQMNYWPTMASNLGECLIPYNDYLSVLRQAGRQGAASAFGIKSNPGEENGWLVGCFSTPYMFASMGQDDNAAGWNPIGSAWALLNSYEYYLYTGDVEFLKELYPSMKEVANFWNEALYWSEYQQRWVSAPSYSPENGPIVNGASYDQQFIWQHFENTIQAANILGVDEKLTAQWKEKQDKLNPVLVGKDGQVKEWFEETKIGKAQAGNLPEITIPQWRQSLGAGTSGEEPPHRHLSHLMALYPGNMINKDNPKFMDAAIVSLNERGLDATGWSKAHKLNLWARAGRPVEAFQIVQSAVGGGNSGFLYNMFSSHGGGANYKGYPIFQIDGNFGYTAGVNEMLIQSQLGYTQFLPALPEQWNNGHVNGIVARGNFEINMEWSDGTADCFEIISRNGGTFTGEYTDLAKCKVTTEDGKEVEVKAENDNKISFPTKQGEKYIIDLHSNPGKLQGFINRAKEVSAQMTDEILGTRKAALDKVISEAEKAIEKGDSSKYREHANKLGEVIAIAENAIQVKDAYNEAKVTYEERNLEETWPTYISKAESVKQQMDAAVELLKEENPTKQQLNMMKSALENKKNDFTSVWNQLSIWFMPNGGNLAKEQEIELKGSVDDLVIRYTTDGNDPMYFSDKYESPFKLTESGQTVKAAFFLGERQMGNVFSADFFMEGALDQMQDIASQYARATDEGNSSYPDSYKKALDGSKNYDAWYPGKYPAVLTVEYDEPVTFNTAEVAMLAYLPEYNKAKITDLNIEYWNGETWVPVVAHETLEVASKAYMFNDVTTNKVRLNLASWDVGAYGFMAIDAFRLFRREAETVSNMSALDLVLQVAAQKIEDGSVDAAIPEVQASFNKIVDYAKAVTNNIMSTQETVDRTAMAVIKEIENLGMVAGDKRVLTEHYTLYSTLNLELYVEGAEKEAFKGALEAAKAVLDDENALETAVMEVDNALLNAANALVKKGDKTDLQKLVDTASTLKEENYLPTEWGTFMEALESAKKVLEDDSAVQSDVDAEYKLLAQAQSLLKEKADKSVLAETIEKAKAIKLDEFKKNKVKAFKEALKVAENVYNYEGLSVAEQPVVDAATKDLLIAMDALKDVQLPFKDVADDAWYKEYVEYVFEKKLMTGLSEDMFGPGEGLARAQFAVILYRMNGSPEIEYSDKFADIANNEWYTDAILWANSVGVVEGYSNSGLFGPADAINREQMATMMYRYAQYKKYDVSTKADFSGFVDAENVNEFAKEAMQWAFANDIITGKDNGTKLDPQGNASRAECATIITRFMETYK